jgi:hypothetical protein
MTINNDIEIDRPEVNPVCICKGNWKNLVHEYQPLFGKKFIDENKEIFTFEGLLWANDDFYFCMVDTNHKIHLDTCVGSLETLGYKLYIDDTLFNNIDDFNHNSIISISQLDEIIHYNSYVDIILTTIEIDELQKIGYSIEHLDNLIVRDIDEVNKTMSYLVRITK